MKKRMITALSVTSCLCALVGAVSVCGLAEEDSGKLWLSSESNGYLAVSQANAVEENSSVSMTFSVDDVVSLADEYLGFGIVREEDLSLELIGEENQESGYAFLFGNGGTTSIGADGATLSSTSYTQADFMKSGYTYKATFDNGEERFVLERKTTGSNLFSVVFEAENVGKLVSDHYVFGLTYSAGVEVLLESVTFASDETEILSGGLPTYANGINRNDGGAYLELRSQGVAYYANETPVTPNGKGEIVISLKTSQFAFGEDAEIGFAIGTPTGGALFGGEKGKFFAYGEWQGTKVYENGSFAENTYEENFLDVHALFTVGRALKGIFNVNEGSFTLLACLYEGSEYVELQRLEGLDLPKTDVCAGLQMKGNVTLKTTDVSVGLPADVESYATRQAEFYHPTTLPRDPLTVTKTATGTTIELEEEKEDYTPSVYLHTNEPVSVGSGESVIVLFENLQEVTAKSLSYTTRMAFTFSNGNFVSDQYMYQRNTALTLFYERGRSTYFLNQVKGTLPDGNLDREGENVDLGARVNSSNVFKAGNSVMAVFTPEYQAYSLYVKSSVEPDYTLWQTYVIPESKRAKFGVSSELYVGFELCGGMRISVENYGVYKAKTSDIGVTPSLPSQTAGEGEKSAGGFIVESLETGYVAFKDIAIENADGIAIEYELENVSYSDGSYHLGFLITDGEELPSDPRILDRVKSEVLSGSFIEGDTSEFYSFIESQDLTDNANDRMRTYLFHSGYKIRVVFDLKNRLTRFEYKNADGLTWNEVDTYADLPDFLSGNAETLTVALRLENTVRLALSELKAYAISSEETSSEYAFEGGYVENIGNATMCSLKLSPNPVGGRVWIDEEDKTAAYLLQDTTVTLYAEPSAEYVFVGWYKGGNLVSESLEYEFDVVESAEYEGRFAPASRLLIVNGADRAETEVDGYYQDGSYLGINPQKVSGKTFLGWTLSYIEEDENGRREIGKYTLSLTAGGANDMLSGQELNVWKSLRNEISSGDSVTVTQNDSGSISLSFGIFEIVDRKGYENGALIVKIPELKSTFDDEGNPTLARYAQITANYAEKTLNDSITLDKEYGEKYKEDYAQTTVIGIVVVLVSAAVIGGFVAWKIIKGKRR